MGAGIATLPRHMIIVTKSPFMPEDVFYKNLTETGINPSAISAVVPFLGIYKINLFDSGPGFDPPEPSYNSAAKGIRKFALARVVDNIDYKSV